jgi:thioesterase domain-containing protein
MANPTASESSTAESSLLRDLQSTLEREIPMCAQMGIRVHRGSPEGLVMWLPLGPNRNHQQTAFAGSLNAVCTIAGWGTVFLLLKDLGRKGNIVIRRSTIRYHQPVNTPEILAHCQAVTQESRKYFLEMLDDKRQAKLDLEVEIPGQGGPLVSFSGSYVVTLE